MSTHYDGKQLARCFDVVSATYREIDSLIELLNNNISDKVNGINDHNGKKLRIQEPTQKDKADESGWIKCNITVSFEIFRGKKQAPSSYLGYQISLLGDGMILAEEPLIHFCHWVTALGIDDNHFGFSLDLSDSKIDEGKLITWKSEDESVYWTFSVRLTSINNVNDITRIADTIASLLEEQTSESIPDDIHGLVRYHMNNDKEIYIDKPTNSGEAHSEQTR